MNNSQFRKLVLDTPARQSNASGSGGTLGATPRRDGATPMALGSRMRSSIPMTPRSIAVAGGIDFARQLAERNAANQPTKKFRSTATPKGAKLASGYIDRTKERVSEEEDDKAARVKALEEMVKLQQIDQATFEKLRDEIVGGDVDNVHLVKGLDYKLLERVRRGEDVLNRSTRAADDSEAGNEDDAERELEMLEDKEIEPVMKEKAVKRGEMAPPSLVPGRKRNRDQILAELKAARAAAKEAAVPSLGAKFKKVGAPRSTSRIQMDGKGREVLIVVDENGNEKRKVRKAQPERALEKGHGLLMPDKDAVPLGMEVPEIPQNHEEEEDINIFDDAGDDYDPLAGLEDDEDDEDDEDIEEGETRDTTENKTQQTAKPTKAANQEAESSLMPPPVRPRNYFNETPSSVSTGESTGINQPIGLKDATVIAALKKVSSISLPTDTSAIDEKEAAAREARRKKMLQMASDDRDAADMDLGFGSSRFEDEEDFEEKRVKLSQWTGDGGDDDEGGGKRDGKGKGGRKRGPKKRKGDKDSAADVLGVLERRKAVRKS